MNLALSLSPEQQHLDDLLQKCRHEIDPTRLWNHLQALKTFLLAHQIQQSTLLHQIKNGKVVDNAMEERLIDECANCLGDTKKVVKQLHRLLRQHEKDPTRDSMEFRVDAARLLKSFDKSLDRFHQWLNDLSQGLLTPVEAGSRGAKRAK